MKTNLTPITVEMHDFLVGHFHCNREQGNLKRLLIRSLRLLKKVPNKTKPHNKVSVGIAWSTVKIVSCKGRIKMFCF
jgi:hypothetical protein